MKATSIFNGNESDNKEMQDNISRLPQDCLMMVMKLTSPKDACRSAAVCTTFQSVADSVDLWQSFLPMDLSSILYRAETDIQQLPISKKELYLHLCRNWILLDGGTKSLRLDLLSGAKIILLHKQYPSIQDPNESPIKIKGAIHCKDLSPKRNYAAYIIFKGMSNSPSLRITQWINDSSRSHVSLIYSAVIWGQKYQTREDGLREIRLGEFNTSIRDDRAVHFVISDRDIISLISDLIFVGIEVRPVC